MRAVDRLRGPFALVALLLTLLAIGGGIYMLARTDHAPASGAPVPGEVRRELGAPPPGNLARDPRAAEAYVRQQTCLANCASEARVCTATSVDDESARTRCLVESRLCEKECR